MKPILYLATLATLLLSSSNLYGTHLMGGEITYTFIDSIGGNYRYAVQLKIYRDCNGIDVSSSQTVMVDMMCTGDFNVTLTNPIVTDVTLLCPGQISQCSGNGTLGFEEHVFMDTILIPQNSACFPVQISWDRSARNNAITTLSNPGNEDLYVEAIINNPTNSSVEFTTIPVPIFCVNQQVNFNHGVINPDGNTLFFELIDCQEGENNPVEYAGMLSGTNPFMGGTVNLDPNTGAISFLPTLMEIGVICVKVSEIDGTDTVGTVVRDIQFTITDCMNMNPTVDTNNNNVFDYQACVGQQICFNIKAIDEDPSDSVLVSTNAMFGTFTPPFPIGYEDSVETEFCWTPTAMDLGMNFFTVTVMDNSCPSVGVNTFTYSITVNEPPEAGADGSTDVCNGAGIMVANLSAQLSNADPGGSWEDCDGTGVDISDPMAVDFDGVPAANYEFKYIVTGVGCPADTAIITVNVIAAPFAGLDGSLMTCTDPPDSQENLPGSLSGMPDPGGTWEDADASGANISDPANADFTGVPLGFYTFRYIVPGTDPCEADTADVEVQVIRCCTLAVDCSGLLDMDFQCSAEVPPIPAQFQDMSSTGDSLLFTQLGGEIITSSTIPCGPLTITASDASSGNGCIADTLRIIRTYSISDGITTLMCSQTFDVVDNTVPMAPMAPAGTTVSCLADVPTASILQATDNCSGTVAGILSESVSDSTCLNRFTLNRKWIFTDDCGNKDSVGQAIVVNDMTDPIITGVTDGLDTTFSCELPAPVFTVSATDNCSFVRLEESMSTAVDACPNESIVTRIWTATDTCGNIATATITIRYIDTTGPVISIPADVTVLCDEDTAASAFVAPSGTDACGGGVTFSWQNVIIPGACPQEYTIERIWSGRDVCNQTTMATQTISVVDTIPPTITPAAPITIECGTGQQNALSSWLMSNGGATATDACNGMITWTNNFGSTLNACGAGSSVPVTFYAEDPCGNVDSTTAGLSIDDSTPPIISVEASDTIVECNGSGNTVDFTNWSNNQGGASATDDCGAVNWTFEIANSRMGCGQTRTDSVLFIVTDACGNSDTSIAKFIIVDTEDPVVPNAPGGLNLDCASDITTPPVLNANDVCQGMIPGILTETVTDSTCLNHFTLSRKWIFTDDCGNKDSVEQIIVVDDNINPIIVGVTDGHDVTLSCELPAPVFNVSATDNCSLVRIQETMSTAAGACPNESILTRIWTATDSCGNSVNATAIIRFIDTTGPVISIPADVTVLCNEDTSASAFVAPSGTDACGGGVTFSWQNIIIPGACPQEYTIERIWTGRDVCNQTTMAIQTISVVDTIPPTITTPAAPITIECGTGQQNALSNWLMSNGGAIATDACNGMITWTNNFGSTLGACGQGSSVPVTFYATDPCGNVDSTTADLTIDDSTPPMISVVAADTVVECDGLGNMVDFTNWSNNQGGASATDDCGAVNWTFEIANSRMACGQTRTDSVLFIVTDACGNSDTSIAKFIIVDTEDPVAPNAPGGLNLECASDITTPAVLNANDVCQGMIPGVLTETVTDSTCLNHFTLSRKWIFTDDCGNKDSVEQIIVVDDNINPIIVGVIDGHDVTLSCELPAPVFNVSATDNCSLVRIQETMSTETGACPNESILTRIWTAIDTCGNSVNATATIRFIDTTGPVISIPADVTVLCNEDTSASAFVAPSGTDACGGGVTFSWQNVITPGACPQEYTIERIWTGRDVCNQMTIATQTISVVDTIPPTITTPAASITIECGSGQQNALSDWLMNNGGASANEACNGMIIWTNNFGSTLGACGQGSSVPVTFYATDPCGNVDSTTVDLSIDDSTPPVIEIEAADTIVECDGLDNTVDFNNWTDNQGGAIATDDCGAVGWSFEIAGTTMACGNTRVDSVLFIVGDACGNTDTSIAKFTVIDTQKPILPSPPGNMMVSCASNIPTATILTANDLCEGSIPGVLSESVSDSICLNEFNLNRKWVFTDRCGNKDSVTQIISVLDDINPSIQLNYSGGMITQDSIINFSCEEPTPIFTIIGSDNCGVFRTQMTSASVPGNCPVTETINQAYTVIDSCGNQTSINLTLIFRDTTAPSMVIPADQTAECNSDLSPATLGSATATDNCDLTFITITSMDVIVPGSCAADYLIMRIWSAMDVCGNTVLDTQNIRVEDTTPPILTAANDVTIECGSGQESALALYIDTVGGASATDNCSDTVIWSFSVGIIPNSCDPMGNATFPITFIATDSCGNMDSVIAMITIQDSSPPIITQEATDTIVECDGAGNTADFNAWLMNHGWAEVTDDCGADAVTWRSEIIASSANGCGSTRKDSVRFIASDICGNMDTTTANFEIIDSEPPVITLIPIDTTVECSLNFNPGALGMATATDNCNPTSLSISSTDSIVNGTCDQNYTIFRIWIAIDECLNMARAVQSIEVIDTTAPTMSCPPQATATCSASEVPVFENFAQFVSAGGAASDICNGLDESSFGLSGTTSVSIPLGFEVTRTYEIFDDCLNRATCQQVIIVEDNEPPEIICIDTFFVAANVDGITLISVDSILLDSMDNCGIATLELSQEEFDCRYNYNIDITRSVTLTATDFAGNQTSCTTVLVISCPCPNFRLQPICQNNVKLSLDENCSLEVTPDQVLIGDVLACYNPYKISLTDQLGIAHGSILDASNIGQTLVITVRDSITGNSCWGSVSIEDKLAPFVSCDNDTLNCWDAEEFLAINTQEDCGKQVTIHEVSRRWIDFNCEDDEFVGYVERSVLVQDQWGNTNRCDNQRIYIIYENLSDLVCPDNPVEIECCSLAIDPVSGESTYVLWNSHYVYEDDEGYSHPIPMKDGLVEPPYLRTPDGPHYIGSAQNSQGALNNGKCNIIANYKDHILPTCGSTYKIRREWKISNWCTGIDSMCVQWIKITDTTGPIVEADYIKRVCLTKTDDQCTKYVDAWDITRYDECHKPKTYSLKHDECVAHVDLRFPNIKKECGLISAKGDQNKIAEALSKIKVTYLIKYLDPNHPSKEVVLSGNLSPEGKTLYLPAGWHQVIYYITDGCWNETYACEFIGIIDSIPPTPICDEITQVTLDPDSCWVRVHAEDLDDGSNDNCAINLHFAVAHMDSILKYQNYWNTQLKACYGEYNYNHHKVSIDALISDWINCFVFNDYIDVSECGRDSLILRVYEADGMPLYDSHIFAGTKHQWFCFNLYDDYACFFKFYYDEFAQYEHPTSDLCAYQFHNETLLAQSDDCSQGSLLAAYSNFITSPYCGCESLSELNSHNLEQCQQCETSLNRLPHEVATTLEENGIGLNKNFLHGAEINRACCSFEQQTADSVSYIKWLSLVEKYPELKVLDCKRYKFNHLSSDCMIEVIKDDKTPPVCIPPAAVIYYCDGVPEKGSIFPNGGNDQVIWSSAQFAHNLCSASDLFSASCALDRIDDNPSIYFAPDDGPWCVYVPWDGLTHGYYNGPINNSYSYLDPDSYPGCDENLADWLPDDAYIWKPVYCRFWLLLDQFDSPIDDRDDNGKPNPYQYFGEPEIYNNCWNPEIEVTTEGELNECGVGSLTRTWMVTDKCGNSSSCHQTITIKPRSDFEVKFPQDIEVTCDSLEFLSPIINDSATYPVVSDDDCELIGISYSDQVIDISQDGCYKILRTWKIIDWCIYNPDISVRYPDVIVDDRCVADSQERPCVIRNLKDDGDGYMTYLQILKVVDGVAPEVVCSDNYLSCIIDENCSDQFVEYDLGVATDNCTEDLQYRYTINPFGNSDTEDWIFGYGSILQNTLPLGIHVVTLFAKDDCGNEGNCTLNIEIKDCKPPTPYCYDGIATVIMPASEQLLIWAKDLNAGSFDNCSEGESLRYTFSLTPPEEDSLFVTEDLSSFKVFDCDDLGQVLETIYVWDESGNVDFCEVILLIQPGSEACPGQTLNSKNVDITTLLGNKNISEQENYSLTDRKKAIHLSSDNIILHQNRPNPFTTETLIGFDLEKKEQIEIRILDFNGKVVKQYESVFKPGYNEVRIDGLNSSGIYYYQFRSPNFIQTKKMILID